MYNRLAVVLKSILSNNSVLLLVRSSSRLQALAASHTVQLGKEARILLKKLKKWEKPYSEVCGYFNARMSIAIARATHHPSLYIRGSRIPTSKMSNRLPQWEDKAGLGLFRL
jgi:hypothetical protein